MFTGATRLGGGFGLGAALMYFLDPALGRRRRALLRDKAVRLGNDADWLARQGGLDILHRAKGAVYKSAHLMTPEHVSDEVLVERVRAVLGRASMHPGAIRVSAEQGVVTLRGPVLEREAKRVVSAVRGVRGVRDVRDELERHKQADDVPGLQGGPPRRKDIPEVLQDTWTLAYRIGAGAAGAALLLYGIKRRGYSAVPASLAGSALLARAVANKSFARIFGIGAGRRAVDVRKTIEIHAPVEEVFAVWANPANFARLMRHVEEVRDLGGGRTHWVARGPAGIRVSWDAEITEQIPHQVFAWKSSPGSTVENAGIVRFERTPAGGTRLDIRMSYNPPAGSVGDSVARLLGADLKRELDEDLNRLKSVLEGRATRAH